MRIKELLETMATDLERSDNEAFLLAEYDEACLERVVAACVLAAEELRKAAQDVDQIEPTDLPVYDWRVWHKIQNPENMDEGTNTKISQFEATYDEGKKMVEEIVKEILGEDGLRGLSGGFGHDGGRLLYSVPHQSVDVYADIVKSGLDADGIESVANLATVLDETGDPALQKQASVLDQLLLTVCANKDDLKAKKARDDARFEEIAKKYKAPREELEKLNKVSDVKKAIEESGLTEKPKMNEVGLSTRYCPNHTGVQMQRIADTIGQCPIDGRVYDFSAGFTLENGVKVPGSSVGEQTIQGTPEVPAYSSEWDSREGRLNRNS